MLLLMVVSLYTSRIVLQALGVVDYGLYNVVGGVVIALGFLQGTLNTTSSRFITVSLGRGNKEELSSVFNNILIVILILAFIIFIISETIGLWFLYNKLEIPTNRFNASFWVYQASVVTVIANIISVPYNACIIAHEKMKAFAYISLFDAFGKLAVAFVLLNVPFDKLIFYSMSLMCIQLIDRLIYGKYCKIKFEETRAKIKIDKKIIRGMLIFIGWSSYGSFVSIGYTQGLNILLNMFFGPAVNAARAISVQVQNAVTSFTYNFQTAINPQLIQSVAVSDFSRSRNLLIASSKLSFYLLCIIGLPVIIFAPTILNIWLKNVPDHTVNFVRLMLCISIWSSLANPLRTINQAEGNIKRFQICECTVLLLIVPFSYFFIKDLRIPELVFIVHLSFELIAGIVRIKIVLPKIRMSIHEYFQDIYFPLALVFILSLFLGYYLTRLMPGQNICSNIIEIVLMEIAWFIIIVIFGLSKSEKSYIMDKVQKKFCS